jgi:hypothetical protein
VRCQNGFFVLFAYVLMFFGLFSSEEFQLVCCSIVWSKGLDENASEEGSPGLTRGATFSVEFSGALEVQRVARSYFKVPKVVNEKSHDWLRGFVYHLFGNFVGLISLSL